MSVSWRIQKTDTAAGMGGAVIFVITIASMCTSLIYKFILVPLDMTYLKTIASILVDRSTRSACGDDPEENHAVPCIRRSGVYLPLITTNRAVLGAALTNVQNGCGVGRYRLRDRYCCRFYDRDRADGRSSEKIEYNDIPEASRNADRSS